MLRFGIFKQDQYVRALDHERIPRSRVSLVSYDLLNVGDEPTAEQIQIFEEISRTLRNSNGTYRTTFPNRFYDLDDLAIRWIKKSFSGDTELRVQDRAASHGLTSLEWALKLFQLFPMATFEASDSMFRLVKLSLNTGGAYVLEPDGQPLQYIKWPFVVSLQRRESWRYPINRLIAAGAKRRFKRLLLPEEWMESTNGANHRVSTIPFVHPKAVQLSKENTRFQLQTRSVFEHLVESCHVLRTMNILNASYFSADQLVEGIKAAFDSLKPGGIWIVGRTLEEDFSNHATLFRKQQNGWSVLERLGRGSEIEELALRVPPENPRI